MGWWTEEINNEELMIGDTPLDYAHTMLSKISNAYKREAGRKPTPAEMCRILELSITVAKDMLLAGMEDREVAGLTLKTKKAPRKQNYGPDAYFAVPLPSGGYGFGRIVSLYRGGSMLVALLGVWAETPKALNEVKAAPVMRELMTDDYALKERSWQVIDYPSDKKPQILGHKELEAILYKLQATFGSKGIPRRLENELCERKYLPK